MAGNVEKCSALGATLITGLVPDTMVPLSGPLVAMAMALSVYGGLSDTGRNREFIGMSPRPLVMVVVNPKALLFNKPPNGPLATFRFRFPVKLVSMLFKSSSATTPTWKLPESEATTGNAGLNGAPLIPGMKTK